MSKFVVVIFADEAKAREGSRAIQELHADASLSLHGMTIAHKSADGELAVADTVGTSMRNAAVGGLVGGLIGFLAGPVGAALGAGGGAWIASWRDITHIGVGADFMDQVVRELTPGRAAVVAEVDEEEITPLDARMEPLGGIVIREWRADLTEARLAQEAAARSAEVEQLSAERERVPAARKAALTARLDDARTRLARIHQAAQERLDALREETDARVESMQAQAAGANPEPRARIEQRIVEARADRDRRTALLEQALTLSSKGR